MTVSTTDYSPLVRELFEHPRAAGAFPEDDDGVVHGEAGTMASGTWVRLHLRIARERVTDARFQAYGCPHTLAAAAWLADHLPGRSIESPLPEGVRGLAAILDVPTAKLGRLLIVEDALADALRRWRERGVEFRVSTRN
jgi:NifU-like N terminal domain